ncbi:hypothetical protein ASE93_12300 [Serratia sp. Leaf50]|uniref:hypothetical protein n=1 Tax=Rouxiella sp. S1S-2 TaxID=2653856 RepID=UPI0007021BCE|nr:hypothetical protein [Rouxiella sp. S1S-2]KAB7896013.1 hypothetical protein GA565_08440 [Rouxiella sp. S1S-2]KQN46885.1 hypothetical protein ASE93_12300 [Serratia sp. Leaf50]
MKLISDLSSDKFLSMMTAFFVNPVELFTAARKKPFKVYSEDGRLFILNSKGNKRPLRQTELEEFHKRFIKTGSITPVTYQDVTFNSSYILAAIEHINLKEAVHDK